MKQSSHPHVLPSSRPSPFDKLATETIAQIFHAACPYVDLPVLHPDIPNVPRTRRRARPNPWMLSAVCKRWRAITIVYHSLWTAVDLNSGRIYRTDWTRWGFSQLRDCLRRSGSHPLKIRITGTQYENAVIVKILDVVQAYSERWNSIAFVFPLAREFLQRFHSLEGRLPMLEHLEIHLSTSRYMDLDAPSTCNAFLSAPALSSMRISPFYGMSLLRYIQIPWTQISEVTFCSNDFCHRRDLYDILVWLSLSLQSLTFSNTLRYDEIWTQPRPVKLEKLRRLFFFEDSTGILDMLSCPSLKELHIKQGKGDEITRFLDDSSCTLMHIHLGNILPRNSYEDLHHSRMVMENTSLSTLQSISLTILADAILDLLIFDSRRLFPSLETLRVDSLLLLHSSKNLASQIDSLRNIVQSRTYATPSDDPKSSTDTHKIDGTRNIGEYPLKNCLFTFTLDADGPDMYDYWDTTPLEALKSFCISRDTRVLMEIFYTWNRYPLTDEEYDSTDDDATD